MQVPKQDRSCLWFFWRPRTKKRFQIDEYQRLVLEVKSSLTFVNYALKRVALDNEEDYPISEKAILYNFYMDDFTKSLGNPEEAIEVFNQ